MVSIFWFIMGILKLFLISMLLRLCMLMKLIMCVVGGVMLSVVLVFV